MPRACHGHELFQSCFSRVLLACISQKHSLPVLVFVYDARGWNTAILNPSIITSLITRTDYVSAVSTVPGSYVEVPPFLRPFLLSHDSIKAVIMSHRNIQAPHVTAAMSP